ncbi:histidine kinase [Chenggangzhangella methanolivorans]|uniref:HAMP domain-containing protein n=1 Tax=Chenggangzhangella methanolivorans TaxID=1437009 RepID=A0A9E6R7Z3_9HYPH|nr:histidine kinase [Chenggangzhangella methanolivorans]QZN98964.1 HAMP domain-containing protein [Chenggangzhangella methanolivorans]
MSLLTGLMLRVFAVVAACLAGASAWTMVEANQSIRTELAATATRVQTEARSLAWREVMFRGNEGSQARLAFPEWRTANSLRIVGPGYCVTLEWNGDAPARVCGGDPGRKTGAAPEWFSNFNAALFGPIEPELRTVTSGRHEVGTIRAEADQAIVDWQAWRQVSVVVGVAGAMAVAIALLASFAIGHALRPAEVITRGLKKLEDGDLSVRLPSFAAREFAQVASAFNELSERLARSTEQRAAVTRRLFQVQEDERRSLARDLHDEFGQCLAATRALAAAVAVSSRDRPAVWDSAREIGVISEGMAATLRSTLARLRPPELDEIGLRPSLEHLVSGWNARTATATRRPTFRLEVSDDFDDLAAPTALAVYRIAQEGLTNAAKHGAPSLVRIRVARVSAPEPGVAVSVDDDGGGDASALSGGGTGHGLIGIRERVDALGGRFVAEASDLGGVRIAASLPLGAASAMAA